MGYELLPCCRSRQLTTDRCRPLPPTDDRSNNQQPAHHNDAPPTPTPPSHGGTIRPRCHTDVGMHVVGPSMQGGVPPSGCLWLGSDDDGMHGHTGSSSSSSIGLVFNADSPPIFMHTPPHYKQAQMWPSSSAGRGRLGGATTVSGGGSMRASARAACVCTYHTRHDTTRPHPNSRA